MANKKVSQLTSKPSVLTTDLFPIADPSTGQLYKTTISDLGTAIGSGVSSVNSLVGAVVLDTDDIQELVSPTNKWFTDTRARAALSASSPLTYNSGTGVFGIQVANGSQNGYLSSTDWTTFNAKQAALSGTGFVKSTGGTISYDTNTYLTTSAAASTYLALGGGTMTGVLFGASASFSGYVGFNGNTSPLYPVDVDGSGRFSGDLRIESTNPRIYLTDTDNNPDYFISNTDGTFTIYDVTNSTARFTIGTTGNATFTNAITGGGSITGQSLYSNGIISAGTSLSVGTFVSAGGSLTGSALYVTGMTSGSGALYYSSGTNRVTVANYNASGIVSFEVNGGYTALTLNSNLSATFASTLSATGATLTGALSGTSATFNGKVLTTASGNDTFGFQMYKSGTTTTLAGFYQNTTGDGLIAAYNSAGTQNVQIATNGVSYFNGGNVGIGTTSPDSKLNITGGSTRGLRIDTDSGVQGFSMSPNSIFGIDEPGVGNGRFIINTNGRVGIGTSSPGQKLDVFGRTRISNPSNSAQFLEIYTDGGSVYYNAQNNSIQNTAFQHIFFTDGASPAERMRITSGGTVCIGRTTAPSSAYTAAFQEAVAMYITSNGNNMINWFNASGTYVSSIVINSSTVMYNTVSDYRLKEDLKSFKGLDLVSKINVYDYKWKSDGTRMYGVVAHELQEVLPDAVSGLKDAVNPDGTIKNQGVDYSKIVPVMVQAIKELKAELDTLKNK